MTFEFAKHIVQRVTGKGVHDANILVTGQRGKGKSIRGGEIAEACAAELSLWKYGDEKHTKEFFDPELDLAVILEEEILKVLARETDNYHIKVVDDVAYVRGFNSRRSLSNEADATTSLFGINRTKRGILIIISQDQDYLDVRLREQADYIIEQTGPMYNDYDISFGTLSLITKHNRAKNKIRYPYMTTTDPVDHHKIRLGILAGGYPSQNYMNVYGPKREAAVNIVAKRKFEKIGIREPDNNEKCEEFDYHEPVKKEKRKSAREFVREMRNAGADKEDAWVAVKDNKYKINRDSFDTYWSKK
jgi:hypothetical protein